jgi:hypothetical protein
MTRLQKIKNRAHRQGCHVIPSHGHLGLWDVYVEDEGQLGPRGLQWSKRKAIRLAHSISISKKQKILFTTK